MKQGLWLGVLALALWVLWFASRPTAVEIQTARAGQGALPVHESGANELQPANEVAPRSQAIALNQWVGPRIGQRQGSQQLDTEAAIAQYIERMTRKPTAQDVMQMPYGLAVDLSQAGQSVMVVRQVNGRWVTEEY